MADNLKTGQGIREFSDFQSGLNRRDFHCDCYNGDWNSYGNYKLIENTEMN